MNSLKKKMSGLKSKSVLDQHYDIKETLGSGTFSTVKLGFKKTTGEACAVKIIDKKAVGDKTEMMMTEVEILKKVKHANIIALKEMFETPQSLYLVMELVTGGELFDRIVDKGNYTEADAAALVQKILDAVAYLHSLGIIHRDLKPENLLYSDESEDAEIKIADFGLSKIVQDNTLLKTACGTPGYVAPEVLQLKGYDKAVDLWSIGVIMYILLCGFPPFYDDNTADLFEQIMAGDFDYPDPYWTDISDDAKDLINKLLIVDPKDRITAEEALEHQWITGANSDKHLDATLEAMKKFNARRRFKLAIHGVMAMNRFQNLLGGGLSKTNEESSNSEGNDQEGEQQESSNTSSTEETSDEIYYE